MEIRLLRNVVIDGIARQAGDVIDADRTQAMMLISMKKALPMDAAFDVAAEYEREEADTPPSKKGKRK